MVEKSSLQTERKLAASNTAGIKGQPAREFHAVINTLECSVHITGHYTKGLHFQIHKPLMNIIFSKVQSPLSNNLVLPWRCWHTPQSMHPWFGSTLPHWQTHRNWWGSGPGFHSPSWARWTSLCSRSASAWLEKFLTQCLRCMYVYAQAGCLPETPSGKVHSRSFWIQADAVGKPPKGWPRIQSKDPTQDHRRVGSHSRLLQVIMCTSWQHHSTFAFPANAKHCRWLPQPSMMHLQYMAALDQYTPDKKISICSHCNASSAEIRKRAVYTFCWVKWWISNDSDTSSIAKPFALRAFCSSVKSKLKDIIDIHNGVFHCLSQQMI